VTSGALAALGGAYLSLVQVGLFNRGMTQGRGFLALAAVIFAKWRPLRLVLACLLFGLADAVQFRAQVVGVAVPHELLLALPYVLALAALAWFAAGAAAPAAVGRPFRSE
jgi:simple sugar transport system permease protein